MFSHVKKSLLVLAISLAMIGITLLARPSTAKLNDAKVAQTSSRLRFVNDTGIPITGKVRLLCYTKSTTTRAPVADVFMQTNTNGKLTTQLPAGCKYIAALHLKHEQPSGKPNKGPAFWIYATSWPPGTIRLQPTNREVRIRDKWPLVLFNVTASLAWEPEASSSYTEELWQGLHDASAYLYDLTDGRMAIGPVTIDTDGRNWNEADLRILAANDYRPAAFVGGIVPKPIAYTPVISEIVFAPASIYLGRYWDGDEASNAITGTWTSTNAYRTIIHEWGHYALFLYDEYQQTTGSNTYCICNDLDKVGVGGPGVCNHVNPELAASAMAFHYSATELWNSTPKMHGTPLNCTSTLQGEAYGTKSDWDILTTDWYEIQGLTPVVSGSALLTLPKQLDPGPLLGLADDLFGRIPPSGSTLPISSTTPAGIRSTLTQTISISITESLAMSETLQTQVYLLKGSNPAAPELILHQGKLDDPFDPNTGFLGKTQLLGTEMTDNIRVFVDRYKTDNNPGAGGRYSFADKLSSAAGTTVDASTDEWQASLDVIYGLSGLQVTTMTIVLTSPLTLNNEPPIVQFCTPDADTGCHKGWQHAMDRVASSSPTEIWTATFTPLPGDDELPLYGVVRVYAPSVGKTQEPKELIRWIQGAGSVPPAHNGGGTALADGLLMAHADQVLPAPGDCNKMFFMPAASYEALSSSLGEVQLSEGVPLGPVQGVVGLPLDIDILLPENGNCVNFGSSDKLPVFITLTMFYNQDVIDRVVQGDPSTIDENTLQILHFDPVTGWSQVDVTARNTELNWIATRPVNQTGIYAIVWVQ